MRRSLPVHRQLPALGNASACDHPLHIRNSPRGTDDGTFHYSCFLASHYSLDLLLPLGKLPAHVGSRVVSGLAPFPQNPKGSLSKDILVCPTTPVLELFFFLPRFAVPVQPPLVIRLRDMRVRNFCCPTSSCNLFSFFKNASTFPPQSSDTVHSYFKLG